MMIDELGLAALLVDGLEPGGDGGHHVGEDQDRHPLADAALGDQLGQPHDEGRPRREDQHHEEGQRPVEGRDQVDAGAEQGRVVAVEGVDEAGGLHHGQRHGEVAGGLGDLLLADRALVPPLLELGDHRGEQLDDDGARDVGHDAQAEDGQAHQRAAAEEVEEAEHARRRGRALERLQARPVDAGHGDVRPDLVQGDDGQREDDLVAKVGDPEDVGEPGEHGRFLSVPSRWWSLAVHQGIARGGRAPVREGQRHPLDATARGGDRRLGRLGEGVRRDPDRAAERSLAEDLDQGLGPAPDRPRPGSAR